MSLATLSNLGLAFGAFDVFRGLHASIANDSKIGLIGPNGIGKTSLLLILAGINAPSTGGVSIARGRRLGYLRQEAVEAFADRDNTVYAEMLTVFDELHALEARMRDLEARMSAGDHSPEIMAEYGTLQHDFEHHGGYDYELRIKQTLQGLGFDATLYAMPIRHLSGGQKTRALLARLLLEQPDLLILDEPTNHLDSDAVEWLEKALGEWDGALLIVSHDRYFLDNVVNTIWEMSRSGLEDFRGNYSAYLKQRDERYERHLQTFTEEKARLQKDIDFVQRNIARASTTSRAVGLLKRIHRDLLVIDHYGIQMLRSGKSWLELDISLPSSTIGVVDAIRKINGLEPPSNRSAQLKVKLNPTKISGEIVLRTYGLKVGYPGNTLFTAPDLELLRGECAAIIGPNGAGKTTLLKTLLGQLPALAGETKLGASLKIGYFAQAHDALNLESTVLDELLRHKDMEVPKARHYLAQYLFRGEDIYKQIASLSGGERARLALAILALEGANLLLLDEPTNHLDIPAQEILQSVLEVYEGTILLVSHDRYLIDRLATQMWEVRLGQLTVFKGTYREFVASKLPPPVRPTSATVAEVQPIMVKQNGAPPLPPKPSAKSDKDTKRRVKKLADLEEKIAQREAALLAINDLIQTSGNNFTRVRELGEEYAWTQTELEVLMGEWEAMANQ